MSNSAEAVQRLQFTSLLLRRDAMLTSSFLDADDINDLRTLPPQRSLFGPYSSTLLARRATERRESAAFTTGGAAPLAATGQFSSSRRQRPRQPASGRRNRTSTFPRRQQRTHTRQVARKAPPQQRPFQERSLPKTRHKARFGQQPTRQRCLGQLFPPPPQTPRPRSVLFPPDTRSPVGSLGLHLQAWRDLPAHPWVLAVVQHGYKLPWAQGPPPLRPTPPPWRPPSPLHTLPLREAVLDLLQKQAVEELYQPVGAGFYGRLFLVPKSSGGWRPVLDLSPLNQFLPSIRFKMETPSSIRSSIQTADWATSIDLQDAYFHISIHPSSRRYL